MTVGRPAWPTLWPQVDRVVEGLRDGLGDALGDQLVGLYLSGSLAQGGFHPPSSDLDVLVATAGVLDEPTVGRLAELHATLRAAGGWAARLEVVSLTDRAPTTKTFRNRYHLGPGRRQRHRTTFHDEAPVSTCFAERVPAVPVC